MFPGHFCLPSKLQARLVKRPELVPSSCAARCLQRLAPKPTSFCRSLGKLLPLSGSVFFLWNGGHEIQLLWRSIEIHLKISMPQLTKLNLKSSKIYKKKAWKEAFKYWQCGLVAWKDIYTLSLSGCVTLGKKFRILGLSLPVCKMGMIRAPAS